MEEENIITVRNRNLQKADEAFADFMFMLESYLNEKAAAIPGTYCDCKSKELENVVVNVMKELCGRTPFRVEEIRLVSAQYFPDIIAEKYYGVEVKSTKENHWTSTGSSIVESTRDKNVENIYMLFGKLGGKTAEFKCRPPASQGRCPPVGSQRPRVYCFRIPYPRRQTSRRRSQQAHRGSSYHPRYCSRR